ncbi:MAG: sugar ABC transporter permease [Acholeplasmataceae bacterium]|nr:sugar ABC transporter permease [Acholeplasmataceae bacterium]
MGLLAYFLIFLALFIVLAVYFVNAFILMDVLEKKGYESHKYRLKAFIPIYGNKVIKKLDILSKEVNESHINYLYKPYYIYRKALVVALIEFLVFLLLIPLSVIFYLSFINNKILTMLISLLIIVVYLVYQGSVAEYGRKKGYEGVKYDLMALVPVAGFFYFKAKKPLKETSRESLKKVISLKNILMRFFINAELTIMVVIVVLPVLYIFGMAFSNVRTDIPNTLWPKNPNFQAFIFLTKETNFWTWYRNTLGIAVINMIIGTIIITGASYVFARYSFKGKKAGLLAILVLQAFPSFMGLIAMYVLFWKFGLLGKPLALSILYIGGSIPGNLWLIKGFLSQIPKDLDESAMIDGASKVKIFTYIILPLAVPILTFVAVSMFMGPWMDYMLPSYLLDHMVDAGDATDRWTLAVGIYKFINDANHLNYSAFAAASLIVGIPIAVLYMIFQKYLIEGIMAGATKG